MCIRDRDYDELYLRAAREYFGILMDVEYPLQLRPVGEPAKEKSMHACGTTFILPALIDHFLIMYLQNRLLFSGLSKIGSGGKVDVSELSQEEVWLYQAFTFGKLNGSAVFGGTQHQTMNKVYQMFVSHALIVCLLYTSTIVHRDCNPELILCEWAKYCACYLKYQISPSELYIARK